MSRFRATITREEVRRFVRNHECVSDLMDDLTDELYERHRNNCIYDYESPETGDHSGEDWEGNGVEIDNYNRLRQFVTSILREEIDESDWDEWGIE